MVVAATRATDDDIHELMPDLDSGFDSTKYIRWANVIVTTKLTGLGFSADYLKMIEEALAAHFVAIAKPENNIMREKIGDADAMYHGKSDMHLNFTKWGQQAMILDTSGTLSKLGKRRGEVKAIM
jgi:hypothetical protein